DLRFELQVARGFLRWQDPRRYAPHQAIVERSPRLDFSFVRRDQLVREISGIKIRRRLVFGYQTLQGDDPSPIGHIEIALIGIVERPESLRLDVGELEGR